MVFDPREVYKRARNYDKGPSGATAKGWLGAATGALSGALTGGLTGGIGGALSGAIGGATPAIGGMLSSAFAPTTTTTLQAAQPTGVPAPSPKKFTVSAAAGGGSGGGYGAGGLSPEILSMLQAYQEAQTSAKTENERRYADILSRYETRTASALKSLEGLGAAEAADITARYKGAETAAMQDLVSSGLSGTTAATGVRAGMARKEASAQAGLQERLRRERVGYETGLTGDQLAFMERREDTYPDLGSMLQLAQMAGEYGGNAGSDPSGLADYQATTARAYKTLADRRAVSNVPAGTSYMMRQGQGMNSGATPSASTSAIDWNKLFMIKPSGYGK